MKFNRLGNTDILVSQLSLGTMIFGEQINERDAVMQMDYAFENGINTFDTAEIYPVPSDNHNLGNSEKIIGKWIKNKMNRENIILASKLCGPSKQLAHIRNGNLMLKKENIIEALELSLDRLQTDYIDLYYLHWPERQTNNFGKLEYSYQEEPALTDIREIIQTLDLLVKEGKVRAIGLSNETPWGLASFMSVSKELNLTNVSTIQNPYSLLNRSFEIGLAEFSHRDSVGLMAYSPLGFGVLTGKYLNDQKPHDSRRSLYSRNDRYSNTNGTLATESYVKIANEIEVEPFELALSFVSNQPFVTSTIIAASKLSQLAGNIRSLEIKLDDATINKINFIHKKYPNPCP